jgi:TusA-related sulfurtransferase
MGEPVQPPAPPEGIAADRVFDGGDMDCGSGLILLIRQQMMQTPESGVLELRSSEPTVTGELPPWCAMTGHAYLGTLQPTPGRWRHFVRRGADQSAEAGALEHDKEQARRYAWRVRVRAAPEQRAAYVYARNFSWTLGQPASFEEKDAHPSAVEAVLGALAADLASGFATLCRQRGLEIDDLEATASGTLENILVHLGIETQGGPGFARIDVTCFVTSPAAGAALREAWQETLVRSPLWQTLKKAALLESRLAIL